MKNEEARVLIYENKKFGEFLETLGYSPSLITDRIVNGTVEEWAILTKQLKEDTTKITENGEDTMQEENYKIVVDEKSKTKYSLSMDFVLGADVFCAGTKQVGTVSFVSKDENGAITFVISNEHDEVVACISEIIAAKDWSLLPTIECLSVEELAAGEIKLPSRSAVLTVDYILDKLERTVSVPVELCEDGEVVDMIHNFIQGAKNIRRDSIDEPLKNAEVKQKVARADLVLAFSREFNHFLKGGDVMASFDEGNEWFKVSDNFWLVAKPKDVIVIIPTSNREKIIYRELN